MTLFLDGCIIVLTVLAGLCALAGKPTPGGVNANTIMLLPAIFFAGVDVLFVLWRFAE